MDREVVGREGDRSLLWPKKEISWGISVFMLKLYHFILSHTDTNATKKKQREQKRRMYVN